MKFNANDAYENLENITATQAQKWAQIANETYLKYRSLGGKETESKNQAVRRANSRILQMGKVEDNDGTR